MYPPELSDFIYDWYRKTKPVASVVREREPAPENLNANVRERERPMQVDKPIPELEPSPAHTQTQAYVHVEWEHVPIEELHKAEPAAPLSEIPYFPFITNVPNEYTWQQNLNRDGALLKALPQEFQAINEETKRRIAENRKECEQDIAIIIKKNMIVRGEP